jgi:hypothetical protein
MWRRFAGPLKLPCDSAAAERLVARAATVLRLLNGCSRDTDREDLMRVQLNAKDVAADSLIKRSVDKEMVTLCKREPPEEQHAQGSTGLSHPTTPGFCTDTVSSRPVAKEQLLTIPPQTAFTSTAHLNSSFHSTHTNAWRPGLYCSTLKNDTVVRAEQQLAPHPLYQPTHEVALSTQQNIHHQHKYTSTIASQSGTSAAASLGCCCCCCCSR